MKELCHRQHFHILPCSYLISTTISTKNTHAHKKTRTNSIPFGKTIPGCHRFSQSTISRQFIVSSFFVWFYVLVKCRNNALARNGHRRKLIAGQQRLMHPPPHPLPFFIMNNLVFIFVLKRIYNKCVPHFKEYVHPFRFLRLEHVPGITLHPRLRWFVLKVIWYNYIQTV